MVCCKKDGIASKVDKKAWSQKKVTKVDTNDNSVSLIFGVIDYINSLPELEYSIWDNRPLDDINIPAEFADFVIPSAVRYDALNRRTKDLLVKPHDVTNPCTTYDEYVQACDKFRSRFKKDGYSDMVKLGSIRKAVNLNDVITRASVNGKVCAQGKPFIPVPIRSLDLFEDRYFNETVDTIIDDFIAEMRFI